MTTPRRIRIFDTTLRDGEQSPGASMNLTEKLEIAQALVQLGVDIIEAGFPIASPGDFESVRDIAGAVSAATVCGLARCNDADIDRAWEALRHARQPRIHVFLATSSIHREFKLRMNEEEVLARAVAGVTRARGLCGDVEFSPEDAARTEIDFLCRVVEAVIAAGATTVNIPDTVGYATPLQMHHVIKSLRDRVPNIDRAVISVHCHDDLGLAVANSLAAVEAGAGQVDKWLDVLGIGILGDPTGLSGGHTNMWRWQSLQEYSFQDVLAARATYARPVLQSYEWNVPGHEHCSMGRIDGQFGTTPNATALAQFEYLWDGSDRDLSGGGTNGWLAGSSKNDTNNHAKALQAVAWLQANAPLSSYLVFAHPERRGVQSYPPTYTGTGSQGYSVAAFRDLNSAGPDVAFGFESS
jgi:hypothetical protein